MHLIGCGLPSCTDHVPEVDYGVWPCRCHAWRMELVDSLPPSPDALWRTQYLLLLREEDGIPAYRTSGGSIWPFGSPRADCCSPDTLWLPCVSVGSGDGPSQTASSLCHLGRYLSMACAGGAGSSPQTVAILRYGAAPARHSGAHVAYSV